MFIQLLAPTVMTVHARDIDVDLPKAVIVRVTVPRDMPCDITPALGLYGLVWVTSPITPCVTGWVCYGLGLW